MQNLIRRYGTDLEKRAKRPPTPRRIPSDTPKIPGEGSPHIFYLPEGGFSENKTIFGGDSINVMSTKKTFPTMKTIVKIKDFGITKLNNAEYQLLEPHVLW